MLVFDEFSVGPKSTNNFKLYEEGCQTSWVGGTGGVRRAFEFEEYRKRSDTPLPRSKRRGRRIRMRLAARAAPPPSLGFEDLVQLWSIGSRIN